MKKTYLKTPEAIIKALKEGKEVRDEDGYLYKFIDGLIVGAGDGGDGYYAVGDVISVENRPYILEEKTFEIKVGEWYETRNHQKARCYLIEDPNYFFTIDNSGFICTNKKGYCMEEKSHDLDIIGPWKEDKK